MSNEDLRKPSGQEIILPPECLNLPPTCQEGLRGILTRLQRMQENDSWFKVRTPEELNSLIPQIQEHAQVIYDKLRQSKTKFDYSLAKACQNTRVRVCEAVIIEGQKPDRHPAYEAIKNITQPMVDIAAREGARNMARYWIMNDWKTVTRKGDDFAFMTAYYGNFGDDSAHPAAKHMADEASLITNTCVNWEIVKDRISHLGENPFSPFLPLYELGAASIVVTEIDKDPKEEVIVIHFPVKTDEFRGKLACLAFPDGRPGDQKIRFLHHYHESSRQIRLQNTSLL